MSETCKRGHLDGSERCDLCDKLEYLYDAIPRDNAGWAACSDSLPYPGVEVLVYMPEQAPEIDFGHYITHDGRWRIRGRSLPLAPEHVTHWQMVPWRPDVIAMAQRNARETGITTSR